MLPGYHRVPSRRVAARVLRCRADADPRESGEYVQCCEGLVNCENNWNGGPDIVGKCMTQSACDSSKMCKLLDERIDYEGDACCEGLFECTQGHGRDQVVTCQASEEKCNDCAPLLSDPFNFAVPKFCCGPGVRCVKPWGEDPNHWFWKCVEEEICEGWEESRCVFQGEVAANQTCCDLRFTCQHADGSATCELSESDCEKPEGPEGNGAGSLAPSLFAALLVAAGLRRQA